MLSLRQLFLHAGFQTGAFRLAGRAWGTRALTVLAYHRITDPHQTGFDTFIPNVSATPSDFVEQMAFVACHFNVVSVANVRDWLLEQRPFPSNPLLITFDDGYRDNFEYAFPILQQYAFPAVIFLATNYIGQTKPFFWDLTAYCFTHTTKKTAVFPVLGLQQWADDDEKTAVMHHWLACLKDLPNVEKETAICQLPHLLDVPITDNTFANLCMTWDQVRTMAAADITFGAHTETHPILTRIPLSQAKEEIIASKARIVAETGQPVISFAYPNGQATDYNPALENALQQAGFEMAFTLQPGPSRHDETVRNPYAIRRIFIGHRDNLPRFTAKVMGLPRFIPSLG